MEQEHYEHGVPVGGKTGRQMMKRGPLSPSQVGVLLLDSCLRPVHFNAESAYILGYPNQHHGAPALDAILPSINGQLASPSSPSATDEFKSGRRHYICRAFRLDSANKPIGRGQPRFVIILERAEHTLQSDASQWSEQYHFTARERETVENVLKGLSTKEIARNMSISPSTVKSFLKLIMMKVGASNRAEIIARIKR